MMSLYGRIQVSENPYSGIFYAVCCKTKIEELLNENDINISIIKTCRKKVFDFIIYSVLDEET